MCDLCELKGSIDYQHRSCVLNVPLQHHPSTPPPAGHMSVHANETSDRKWHYGMEWRRKPKEEKRQTEGQVCWWEAAKQPESSKHEAQTHLRSRWERRGLEEKHRNTHTRARTHTHTRTHKVISFLLYHSRSSTVLNNFHSQIRHDISFSISDEIVIKLLVFNLLSKQTETIDVGRKT